MKYLTILALILLTSCDTGPATSDEATNQITYMKDNKSGLCFARTTSNSYGGHDITSITCVPCDSVKNLLK